MAEFLYFRHGGFSSFSRVHRLCCSAPSTIFFVLCFFTNGIILRRTQQTKHDENEVHTYMHATECSAAEIWEPEETKTRLRKFSSQFRGFLVARKKKTRLVLQRQI